MRNSRYLAMLLGGAALLASAVASHAEAPYTIGVSNTVQGNGWREEMICAIKAQALASGEVDKLNIAHRNTDASGQLEDLRNLISAGVDAIVVNPADPAGIKAALDPNSTPLSPGDFIGHWVRLLKPAAQQISDSQLMTSGERQIALERISIRNSINNLRSFPCVKILEDRGKLQIHGAWFDISTGELWIMDNSGDFIRPVL